MKSRLRVGLLFGGRSAEHEISLASARAVFEAVDRARYDVMLIRIDRRGYWHYESSPDSLRGAAREDTGSNPVFLLPSEGAGRVFFSDVQAAERLERGLDVVFPVLHGTYGEDGTVQGLLRMVNLPFVGADVLGSAVGMDKDVTKRLLKEAGYPVGDARVLYAHDPGVISFDRLAAELDLPFFLKPANTGSSVGISKVRCRAEFREALENAFRFDYKLLAEAFIPGRELVCAVIGNENPLPSVLGEISTQHDFYSYEAKYLDDEATTLTVPATIPRGVSDRLRTLSVDVYRTLCCEGMARVDWFLEDDGTPYVNEINTIPGFTHHSMFPMLWGHMGVDFTELVDRLIGYALKRHARDSKLRKRR